MSDTTHQRPSDGAVPPEDVTDPLLWRVAYDVAKAHEPDETGRCRNLLCAGAAAPCPPLANARRAMGLARDAGPATPSSAPLPHPAAPAGPQRTPARQREAA